PTGNSGKYGRAFQPRPAGFGHPRKLVALSIV
ncbi:uncharacterized protein METZ01_LOCUS240861, partial [marine metagenome]